MSSTERLYLPSDDAIAMAPSTKTVLIISGTAIGLVFLIALIIMWSRPARRSVIRYSEKNSEKPSKNAKETQ